MPLHHCPHCLWMSFPHDQWKSVSVFFLNLYSCISLLFFTEIFNLIEAFCPKRKTGGKKALRLLCRLYHWHHWCQVGYDLFFVFSYYSIFWKDLKDLYNRKRDLNVFHSSPFAFRYVVLILHILSCSKKNASKTSTIFFVLLHIRYLFSLHFLLQCSK